MHEVVGGSGLRATRPRERSRYPEHRPDDLRGLVDKRSQFVRISGQTPQDQRLLFEQRKQPTADVAGCTSQQHDGPGRSFRMFSSLALPSSSVWKAGWETVAKWISFHAGSLPFIGFAAHAGCGTRSKGEMLSLRKPSAESIRRFLLVQAKMPFSYSAVGDRRDAARRAMPWITPESNWAKAKRCSSSARAALQRWEQFRLGWVEAWPPDTPIQPARWWR